MENLMLTYSERVAHALKRHGVDAIIGQSNPPGVALACERAGIRQIGYRAENTGSYMASGYGICSGKVPVLLSQNGPAATLIVSGLSECLRSSYPVVALVQDIFTKFQDKNAFQELDHVRMFEPVTKWVRRVNCAERIEDYIDMAFVAATSGRPGPAVLLLPTELVLDKEKHPVPTQRKASYNRYPLDRSVADPDMVEEAARQLAAAERPMIYAGGGVVSSGGSEALRRIQHDFGIPVATTTMGKGCVEETDPLTMGPIGYYMGKRGQTKFMRHMVDNSDLIMLVGNRTNQNGTDMWTCLPETSYIHIDIDPMEIDRNYEALRLVGDAKLTLEALYEALKRQDMKKRAAARPEVERQIAEGKALHVKETAPALAPEIAPTRVERLVTEIDKRLEKDHIVVADASFSSIWLANFITAKDERKFVFPRGVAGIGWGLPMAIGAKAACPDRKVFCLCGDGGFAHAWSEMETLVREGLDVVIVIINNDILGYQKFYEMSNNAAASSVVDLKPVNHAMIAEACGIKGVRVEKPEELGAALDAAFSMKKGSVLLDVLCEPVCIPPLPAMEFLDNVKEV